MERRLGELVGSKRRRPYFDLPGAPVEDVEAALNSAMSTNRMKNDDYVRGPLQTAKA